MSIVTAEHAGTYRQISHRLRVQRGPGKPDTVVERPRREGGRGRVVYADSDAEPTLITFHKGDVADVPALLAAGAIAPYEPPGGKTGARG